MKKTEKNRQNKNLTKRNIGYRIETEILPKNIVTFGELFFKPSDTIRPESTRQFNINILPGSTKRHHSTRYSDITPTS